MIGEHSDSLSDFAMNGKFGKVVLNFATCKCCALEMPIDKQCLNSLFGGLPTDDALLFMRYGL